MKRYISPFLSALLVFYPVIGNAEGEAKATKSSDKANENKEMPKPKNIDKEYGKEGTLNESKSALISVDPLALQNYSKVSNNFDFSTYDKVTLKSVILETLSHSNDLKSANEKVIQTELSYKEAYSGYLPTMDFQYSVKKIHNAETGDDSIDTVTHKDYNEENYKFTIRQSLYTGGATEFKIKSLKSKLEEAKRKYTIVLEEEIQKAIKAYFDVLFNHKSVIVNERNMEKLNKILEITQIKYDSGALSIGDLSAVKANIANASGKLIRVKSDLADAIDFYLYTVGEDFIETAPYEENFTVELTTLEALYEDILENNLNLVNYRLNIQSTKDKLLNMKASFKPKVDLELNYKNVLDKEEFTANEETYDAKVTLNYNLYNGGKDTIATMTVFSSLQELNFRYKEEIKKLKWEISKLYNSIKSLEETLSNTKKEVDASAEMVNSYWEGFQLGEQDLQVLLQGQRQLNGAELDLIQYEQDHLTNIFKLLTSKGELSKYFGIDGGHPDFIDFSNTTGIKQAPKIDLSTTSNAKETNGTLETNTTAIVDENITTPETISADLNSTMDEYLEVVKEAGFDNIINFRDTFLEADDENYTVMISDFTNHYDAYTFSKKNRLLDETFSYEYFNKNGDFETNNSKTKIIDVKTNIAYGIFASPQDAQTAVNNILEKSQKVYKIVQVKEIKELYNSYINGLEAKVEPFIIKPKVIKTFMTNQEFKNKFLSAPPTYYSINVVSFSQMEQAQNLIKQENIEKDSFVFKYGRNGMWVKVMYGVFATYEQAMNELSKHPDMMKKYRPVIEKIGQKQETYNTYKDFNPTPQWYLDELKEKREKKEAKVTPKADEKKTDKKEEIVVVLPDEIVKDEVATPTKPKIFQPTYTDLPRENIVLEPLIEDTITPKEERVVPPQSQISEPQNEVESTTPVVEEVKIEAVTEVKEEVQKETLPEVKEEIVAPKETPVVEIAKEEIVAPVVIEEAIKTETTTLPSEQTAVVVPVIAPTLDSSVIVPTITPSITTPTVANESPIEKIEEKTFKKEEYSSFRDAFSNAPKEYYTIALGTIPDKGRDAFVKRFILGDQFTEFSKKGKTQIYYGIFESIEKAREQKFNLHPDLIDEIKLFKIGRIDKNIFPLLKKNTEIVKETIEPKVENIVVVSPQSQISEPQNEVELSTPVVEEIKTEAVTEVKEEVQKEALAEVKEESAITPKETPAVEIAKEEIVAPVVIEEAIKTETTTLPSEQTAIVVPVIAPTLDSSVVVPTITPSITTSTVAKESPIEKIEEKTFKKEEYSSFREAFKNAPKEYYTIALGTIPDKGRDAFVKRFILGDQFTEFSKKGKTQIYYGIFESIEKAREQKFNLHPKLIGSVQLIKIGRIAK